MSLFSKSRWWSLSLLKQQVVLPAAAVLSSTNTRSQSTHVDWQHAVSAAEKLVGYPTSYLTLRSLLSDEMSNIATHLRKLMATSHPLMDTARRMVVDGPHAVQTRGLVVLLLSKAAMGPRHDSVHHQEAPAGVLHSQRSLAEITEMIHTAQQIHKGVVNLHLVDPAPSSCTIETNPDYEFGNKIAILCGDYLLANACKALAALKDSEVVELVSSAISDFTEAEFLGPRDHLGRPQAALEFDLEMWREKSYLATGSLLAKSCRSALLLAGHRQPATLQLGYAFGRHLGIAWQAQQELHPFEGIDAADDQAAASISSAIGPSTHHIDVTSLPVVLHIQNLRRQRGQEGIIRELFESVKEANRHNEPVDDLLRTEVLVGGIGVGAARQVVAEHCQLAVRDIQSLPESEARSALENIAEALQSVAMRCREQ